MAGRSVRIFLVDGTPQGLRTAEVGNWTGKAVACPRTELGRLKDRDEVHQTGVYILVGPSELSVPSGLSVYVGEGDEVWSRLATHEQKKDFWTWVVFFVSKDENLTKAHVRHLEARLVKEIGKAKRAELMNSNEPIGGGLPEADNADMATFLENIHLLLPTLGIGVFEPELPAASARGKELVLELRWEDAKAECVVRGDQFVVKAGSTARVKSVDSLSQGSKNRREALRASGVLQEVEGSPQLLEFAQDYAFDSLSGAAAAVTGTGLSGPAFWKVKGTDLSYNDWGANQVGTDKGSPAST